MRTFDAGLFLRTLQALQITSTGACVTNISVENQRRMAEELAVFEPYCFELGLAATAVSLRRLINKLSAASENENSCSPDRDLEATVNEVTERLMDEAQARLFLSLSTTEAEYYSRWSKGWEEILTRFPAARSDVEESRKCFALSRYAASVFHSTQVVEAGLIELGAFIGVVDPKSGWSAVDNELKRMPYSSLTQLEKERRDFLEQIRGTVEALKNAWRNKISHAQGKLNLLSPAFTQEIAEEILIATRAFMRRLAEGLPTPASGAP